MWVVEYIQKFIWAKLECFQTKIQGARSEYPCEYPYFIEYPHWISHLSSNIIIIERKQRKILYSEKCLVLIKFNIHFDFQNIITSGYVNYTYHHTKKGEYHIDPIRLGPHPWGPPSFSFYRINLFAMRRIVRLSFIKLFSFKKKIQKVCPRGSLFKAVKHVVGKLYTME